jgi:hypothetical protein
VEFLKEKGRRNEIGYAKNSYLLFNSAYWSIFLQRNSTSNEIGMLQSVSASNIVTFSVKIMTLKDTSKTAEIMPGMHRTIKDTK